MIPWPFRKTLNEEMTFAGEWRFPKEPGVLLKGRLTYKPKGVSTLVIDHKNNRSALHDRLMRYRTIYGKLDSDQNAKASGCRIRTAGTPRGGHGHLTYQVYGNIFLTDEQIESGQAVWSQALFQTKGLARYSGYEMWRYPRRKNSDDRNYESARRNDLLFENSKYKITFWQYIGGHDSVDESVRTLSQNFVLDCKVPMTLDKLAELVFTLRSIISFSSDRKTPITILDAKAGASDFSNGTIIFQDRPSRFGDADRWGLVPFGSLSSSPAFWSTALKNRKELARYLRWSFNNPLGKERSANLFAFNSIILLESLHAKLRDNYILPPAQYSAYMEPILSKLYEMPRGPLWDKLKTTFDYSNTVSLRKRIADCIDMTGREIGATVFPDRKDFIERVVKFRNDRAHGEVDFLSKEYGLAYSDLIRVNLLYKTTLLKRLRARAVNVRNVLENPYLRYETAKLKS